MGIALSFGLFVLMGGDGSLTFRPFLCVSEVPERKVAWTIVFEIDFPFGF